MVLNSNSVECVELSQGYSIDLLLKKKFDSIDIYFSHFQTILVWEWRTNNTKLCRIPLLFFLSIEKTYGAYKWLKCHLYDSDMCLHFCDERSSLRYDVLCCAVCTEQIPRRKQKPIKVAKRRLYVCCWLLWMMNVFEQAKMNLYLRWFPSWEEFSVVNNINRCAIVDKIFLRRSKYTCWSPNLLFY